MHNIKKDLKRPSSILSTSLYENTGVTLNCMEEKLSSRGAVDILIVVDSDGALTSGSLENNVYLVDTAKYLGSWKQGQCELETCCYDLQTINWRVVPINAITQVEISSFTGQMILQGVCVPVKIVGVGDNEYWEGVVQNRGQEGRYQYSCVLSFQGKLMTFDPFINVRKKPK